MQEQLDRPDEDESKDAQRPGQGHGIRADMRRMGKARDVEPEARDGED